MRVNTKNSSSTCSNFWSQDYIETNIKIKIKTRVRKLEKTKTKTMILVTDYGKNYCYKSLALTNGPPASQKHELHERPHLDLTQHQLSKLEKLRVLFHKNLQQQYVCLIEPSEIFDCGTLTRLTLVQFLYRI